MFHFQYEEDFEPSSRTKDWYLYTHKSEHAIAGIRLPGLFETTYYEWQMLGFLSVFLLEGIATYWCFKEGVIITAILASIFVDLVLAIVAHVFQKDICRKQNQLVFESDSNAKATKKELTALHLKQRLFYLLVLISAFFKIYWFFSVYQNPDSTTLFIITCYIVGALLHITCTGYAVFTFIGKRKISREHNQYITSKGKFYAFDPKRPMAEPLDSTELTTCEVGRHALVQSNPGGWLLQTRGVLTDSELREMIGRQLKDEQRYILARNGVEHQMNVLTTDPARGAEV